MRVVAVDQASCSCGLSAGMCPAGDSLLPRHPSALIRDLCPVYQDNLMQGLQATHIPTSWIRYF